MDTWLHDLRFGLRTLARRPLFTLAAVIALGLGIGANGAIYSVFDAVLLSPLDYHQPERLVRLWGRHDGKGLEKSRISPVVFDDLRRQATSFETLAGWWRPDLNLTSGEGDPERVRAIHSTDAFFEVLGVDPILGRGFAAGDDRPGGPAIAWLGHGLWSRRFGGEDVLGTSIELDGRSFEIVGVMPPGFDFPDGTELWLPLGWDPATHSRYARFFGAVGRLADGVSPETAVAELDRLAT
ncbi:MAG: ABC transporter permease, partial [Acidobacteriota bacterium]